MTQNNKPAKILPLEYEDSKCEDKNDFWFSDKLGCEVVRERKEKQKGKSKALSSLSAN